MQHARECQMILPNVQVAIFVSQFHLRKGSESEVTRGA